MQTWEELVRVKLSGSIGQALDVVSVPQRGKVDRVENGTTDGTRIER